jgi:hypothetical protein
MTFLTAFLMTFLTVFLKSEPAARRRAVVS